MKRLIILLFLSILAMPAANCLAQCAPGYSGPKIYGPIPIPVGTRTCAFKIHYCYKAWNDGMITKYAYQYWLENVGDCPLSTAPIGEIQDLYDRTSRLIAEINPEHLKYLPCGLPMDEETEMDISHASCVWENIITYATPEDPNAPNGYEYQPCPGSGTCYERFEVCETCLYGMEENPVTHQLLCIDPLPGKQPNPVTVRRTGSWTTNETCATEFHSPDGLQRPCYPICSSNAPIGPDIGMVDSRDSSRLVSVEVQTPSHRRAVARQHDADQR
jgi:hypothetical protein